MQIDIPQYLPHFIRDTYTPSLQAPTQDGRITLARIAVADEVEPTLWIESGTPGRSMARIPNAIVDSLLNRRDKCLEAIHFRVMGCGSVLSEAASTEVETGRGEVWKREK